MTTQSGVLEWSCDKVRDVRDEQIAEMLADGRSQNDIAEELKLSKGRVSQIVKKIKEEGVKEDDEEAV